MGALVLPSSGAVYLDAKSIIYSVEHVEPYWSLLRPLWRSAGPTTCSVVTSELTLLEALVRPRRSGNARLEAGFRRILQKSPDVRMAPITQDVPNHGASLRATTTLKTPDAIHAATALVEGCALFVTNDQVIS